MPHESNIIKIAIFTRILLIISQYIFNYIIDDHNAGVFQTPINSDRNIIDKIIYNVLGGFLRWDAQYFMHIAHYGYTYENTLAFFPFYPFIARLISSSLLVIVPYANLDSVLLLVFIGLNCLFFVLSALCLYNLTAVIFSREVAYKSAVLFCFNPASIFFIAPYTECFFSYFTFKSMLNCIMLYKKYSKKRSIFSLWDVLLITPICVSTVIRSNGVLNIGFLVYTLVCLFFKHFKRRRISSRCLYTIAFFTLIVLLSVMCLIPFIMYQIFCYYMFCSNFHATLSDDVVEYARHNNFVVPGTFSEHNQTWCHNKLPMAYSYVQSHYWNVGFLKYYEWKQIPNFLVAFPILFIVVYNCLMFLMNNFSNNILDVFCFERLHKKKKSTNNSIFNPVIYVFVLHALFLSIFCILFIHIQVTTRMLASATPAFYWFCANYMKYTIFLKNSFLDFYTWQTNTMLENLIKLYFVSYFFVGVMLFCNFFPWT